jgi:hypothetical protein
VGGGEVEGVVAAIVETAVLDKGDGGGEEGRAPVEGAFDGLVWGAAATGVFEGGDVFGRVAALAAAIGGGFGADEAATDVGVEGGQGDAEFGGGFGGRQVGSVRHGVKGDACFVTA